MKKICILGFCWIFAPLISYAGLKSHKHGEAEMKISQEAKKLMVTIEFSGEDVFGFEKVAETESEKKVVNKVRSYFEEYDEVIEFSDQDSCDPKKYRTRLEAQESNKGGKKNQSAHSEFKVEYTFDCEESPKKVSFLSFAKFPKVKKIAVSYVLGSKVGRGTLTRKKNGMALK